MKAHHVALAGALLLVILAGAWAIASRQPQIEHAHHPAGVAWATQAEFDPHSSEAQKASARCVRCTGGCGVSDLPSGLQIVVIPERTSAHFANMVW